jgi:hypothetical protein
MLRWRAVRVCGRGGAQYSNFGHRKRLITFSSAPTGKSPKSVSVRLRAVRRIDGAPHVLLVPWRFARGRTLRLDSCLLGSSFSARAFHPFSPVLRLTFNTRSSDCRFMRACTQNEVYFFFSKAIYNFTRWNSATVNSFYRRSRIEWIVPSRIRCIFPLFINYLMVYIWSTVDFHLTKPSPV